MNVFRSRARAAGQRKVTMRKAFALVSALAVALAVSTTIAPAQGTTRGVSSDEVTKVRDLSLELVGQVHDVGLAHEVTVEDARRAHPRRVVSGGQQVVTGVAV